MASVALCQSERCLAQQATNAQTSLAALHVEMDAAVQQVQKIVNQPVQRYVRTRGMHVGVFSPGWFHEGASKPDYSRVDVRTTQETPYAQYEYVTSDLNPGVVFLGRDLEFNAMTKYFYLDRSVPKKKLTDAEMVEINRLYRIMGRCEEQLAELENPGKKNAADNTGTTSSGERAPRMLNPYTGSALLLGLVLILYFSNRKRA